MSAHPAEGTLARMFWSRVERSGGEPAQMVKRGGRWETLDWSRVGAAVRELALGLLALGLRPGEAVAVLSRSRAEWVQADFAIFSAGGVTVPIYPSVTAEQVAYVVNDAEARLLLVEDAEQLAKVLQVRGRMAGLARIVVMEGDEDQDPTRLGWEALRRLGRDRAGDFGAALAGRIAEADPQHVATIVYTSGTTGPPKGVVQTHANHLAMLGSVTRVAPARPGDVHVLFLPLAHSFGRLEAFMGVYLGLTTAFAESLDKLGDDIREVRPHFLVAVPRVFEKVHARILADVQAGSRARRAVFAWAMRVGRQVADRRAAGRPVPASLTVRHRLAHRLVFARLAAALGGRLRFAVSGGAALSSEIAAFFHAAGILILEGYGLTESCPVLTFNRLDRFRFGSVGLPVPGVEIRLAADGEILARGPNVAMRGYWKRPEESAATFGADGWLRTGDIGRLDADGFLFITDRKKDLIVTSGGINIAPQTVESLLRSDPFISQALVYGDGRPYPVALVTVDPEAAAALARSRGSLWTDPARLSGLPEVRARVERIVAEANARLQSYARIKRFAVLPAELTEEAGEVTPTQKLKRKQVAAKYADVLAALYESPAPATNARPGSRASSRDG
jgi:long-chain acyl-CoA synthetase